MNMRTLFKENFVIKVLNFSVFPADCQLPVFSEAANLQGCNIYTTLREFSKIALVCKKWLELQEGDDLWEPILNRFFGRVKYDIDLSSSDRYIDKVKLVVKNLKEFKFAFWSCQRHAGTGPNAFYKDMPIIEFEYFLIGAPNFITESIVRLIPKGNLEPVAKLLLFKPVFDADQVASQLFQFVLGSDCNYSFCFQMLIKSHMDLSAFFESTLFSSDGGDNLVWGEEGVIPVKREMIWQVFLRQVDGLGLSDYLECGFNLSALEKNTDDVSSNYSVFVEFLLIAMHGYQSGTFSEGLIEETWSKSHPAFAPCSFTDKKLMEMKSKYPISEREVGQIFRDLIFKCKLNLNIPLELKPELLAMFPSLPEVGTALAFFEAYAHAPFMPKNNVIKEVWNEYTRLL
jgi:hypothetical protein